MPACAAIPMTRRQLSCVPAMASRKYGAARRRTSDESSAYASAMRFRKRARMMHPARQIFAMSPLWMSQPYC